MTYNEHENEYENEYGNAYERMYENEDRKEYFPFITMALIGGFIAGGIIFGGDGEPDNKADTSVSMTEEVINDIVNRATVDITSSAESNIETNQLARIIVNDAKLTGGCSINMSQTIKITSAVSSIVDADFTNKLTNTIIQEMNADLTSEIDQTNEGFKLLETNNVIDDYGNFTTTTTNDLTNELTTTITNVLRSRIEALQDGVIEINGLEMDCTGSENKSIEITQDIFIDSLVSNITKALMNNSTENTIEQGQAVTKKSDHDQTNKGMDFGLLTGIIIAVVVVIAIVIVISLFKK
jgi:hypothetical protein